MFIRVISVRALAFGSAFFLIVFLMGMVWGSASLGGLADTFVFSR